MTQEQLEARRAEWEALVRTWWERLMGPAGAGWQVIVNLAQPLERGGDFAQCIHNWKYRQVTFRFFAESAPSSVTACHEVLHVAFSRVDGALCRIMDALPGSCEDLARQTLLDAEEEMVETMAQAPTRAFGE